ncbi:MAG: hypothetical protein UHS49_05285 [Faecalimonas sp.]|nr:hypothetical protein [Faecalimonas sp.]
MENERIKGLKVTHTQYGEGAVVELVDCYLLVQFQSGESKKFRYPDVFENFLSTEEEEIFTEIEADLLVRCLEPDYVNRKNLQKMYMRSQEYDRQKKEEQEQKRLEQIEKQRKMQQMREQRLRERNEKK